MKYIKKLLMHLEFWKNYIKEHLFRTIIILILGIICIVGFYCFSYNNNELTISGISLNNWFNWISFWGLIAGAFWTIFQYDKNKTQKQQDKASKIAKSFSDSLTTKCAIIYAVIKNSEIFTLLELDKKSYNSFKVFNTNEIRTIYNDDNFIEKYRKTYLEANLDQIYYRILDTRISFNDFKDLTKNNKHYPETEAKLLFVLDNSCLPFHFNTLVSDVLNELEYLCMNLSSQAAGSKYVYQSLHQVFLRTVRLLCVQIALSNNKSYSDKYYTNIIHIYNEWSNLYLQNLKKEEKLRDKVNNTLNPKIKTV